MQYFPPTTPEDHGAYSARGLRSWQRLVVLLTGVMLVGLLATAACLTPSSKGLGTHQQLGLPPCTIRVWYDLRCPSCGMTTSWSHMMRGQVLAAARANTGGAVLAAVCLLLGPWMVGSGLAGRWIGGPPREEWTIGIGLFVMAVTLIDWSIRLYVGG
ncbi:MAG: DUF2752 domain-containing protein [Pirellulaceae bacterium]|nr:DUF2752 domain-containing protein [Pirellulaceae bacterium]